MIHFRKRLTSGLNCTRARIGLMSGTNLQTDYKIRMNRVFGYIDQHLDSNLTLETIAAVAYFSPFHFHRIFRSIAGETLNEYITRRRIEKSAIDLLHSDARVTEITLKNGFSCNSAFTRAFRKFYGVSPTEFRRLRLSSIMGRTRRGLR